MKILHTSDIHLDSALTSKLPPHKAKERRAELFSALRRLMNEAEEAIGRITSARVSPAIRDADMNGLHVTEGDTIGIIDKEIIVSDPNRLEAAVVLAERLLRDDKFMLTVFRGQAADEEEQEALQAAIAERCPDAEVYFVDGGQAIYPYIFVAE